MTQRDAETLILARERGALDDVGILTLRYHAYGPDGQALARWKATSVYRHAAGEWRMVHARWSLVKDA